MRDEAYLDADVERSLDYSPRRQGGELTLDAEDPDGQTLLFFYPTHFGGEAARYVRPIVKIEFGARSDPWPAHERSVHPVIAEVFPQLFT